MKTPRITLSKDDAMVLQQISETGEEDVISLAESLGMRRHRVVSIIEKLRRKGLITVQRTAGDWWVHLSNKGKQVTHYVWPEMSLSSSAL